MANALDMDAGNLQTSARARSGRARPEQRCEACSESIENPRRGQRFCGRRCATSQWADEHRRPYIVARPAAPCQHCGEPIVNPRRNQRFCRAPRACRSQAGYERDYSSDGATAKYAARAGAGIVECARPRVSLPVPVSAARNARGSEIAPMISVLLESMPAPGSNWPRDARAQWMLVLERTLDAIYPEER